MSRCLGHAASFDAVPDAVSPLPQAEAELAAASHAADKAAAEQAELQQHVRSCPARITLASFLHQPFRTMSTVTAATWRLTSCPVQLGVQTAVPPSLLSLLTRTRA